MSGIKLISPSEPYYDLGSYKRVINTNSPSTQTWFNRGLVWSYAFNHEEAALCFEQSIAHDENCVMAYWGLAYCLGPNYNKPWEAFDDKERDETVRRAQEVVAEAKAKSVQARGLAGSKVEDLLVDALQFRYLKDERETELRVSSKNQKESLEDLNQRYANAMEHVYREFPEDMDVATLYADALMNLTPWALWDIKTGKPATGSHTLEAKNILEQALSRDGGLFHPGLLHLYIHLMEMSPKPEAALPIANHLRNLVPDAGHLQHMPTHLDVLCGDYTRAMESNAAAITADEKFLARSGPLNFYTLYRSHDYHFRIYAAMFAGQFKPALETCARLEASIPEDLLRVSSPPMADWLEGFLSARVHVLVRFGRWIDILNLPLPQDQTLYCVTTAMTHYAKCIAHAASSDLVQAQTEQASFEEALHRVPSSRTLFNNKCVDILAVAHAMLKGEVEYRRGEIDAAFRLLRHAIALDDSLPYDEPWGWMQPTRHAYGALLLEQGCVEEAEGVYAADLGESDELPRALRHPGNVWALHGWYECLVRLGREEEAGVVQERLSKAMAMADVTIRTSCACRLTV